MFKSSNKKKNEYKLYNKILLLSRNKFFYTKMSLKDTFQNRIYLIFLHISFIFINIKNHQKKILYKKFHQDIFDLIFKQIENNMREIGYSDITVNKNMKFFVKNFYNILLNCENYKKKTMIQKNSFLLKYLLLNDVKIKQATYSFVEYFDKYQSFCFYLSLDSVLKGNLNFVYK